MRVIPFILVFMLLATIAPTSVRAQNNEICFPDIPGIDNCLDRAFAPYWQQNGALPVFGYPIGPIEQYQSPDNAAILNVQWTERHRLELHPQNPPAYRVLLGRMGAERLAQLGRIPANEYRDTGPQAGCLWFAETNQNVCDQAEGVGFRSYWEANGLQIAGLSAYQRSLALFGLPLTAAQPEPGPNGELIITQWFERARFEWHPDNPDQFKVLLGLLGREVRENGNSPQPALGNSTNVFGIEVLNNRVTQVSDYLTTLKPDWVRYNGVLWHTIEARRGVRDWSRLAVVDRELQIIAASGAETMLIIRGTPTWAQQVSGKTCGPIKRDALPDFAAFVGELVQRYSAPPYNVKYWEFGNEPDVDPNLVDGAAPFGCLGNARDPYYGGAQYAEMLAAVYPVIKAADPEAQVVLGGLLLDCDHTAPPSGKDCLPSKFLEGILRAGGGEHFDMAAYHAYMYWADVEQDWDLLWPAWKHRGGSLVGKLDFVRETLATYGYIKPVIMNEGGLLCFRSSPDCIPNGLLEDQANYAVRMYTRSIDQGLSGSIWYMLNGPGWQEGGLLDQTQQPRPAFRAIQFLRSNLAGSVYLGAIDANGLEGYAFRKDGRIYEILWSNDNTVIERSLESDVVSVYNPEGVNLALDGSVIEIGFEPRIIVRTP